MRCHVNFCHVMSCHATPCHVMSCHVMYCMLYTISYILYIMYYLICIARLLGSVLHCMLDTTYDMSSEAVNLFCGANEAVTAQLLAPAWGFA